LCEAFALGVPVAASRFGTFEELVESRGAGRLFSPGDPGELQKTVSSMWEDAAGLQAMSVASRLEFESSYSASRSLGALEAIYQLAIKAKSDRAPEYFRQQKACLVRKSSY
jgi:glycosyltransferase involved in cell wall biosynthesis